MTRILGLTHYLGHEQLAKQGLRLWFANRADQPFDDCVEIGARYQARLPTFQVDRAKLDAHLLELAVEAGCELWRPAKVTHCDLGGTNGQQLSRDRSMVRNETCNARMGGRCERARRVSRAQAWPLPTRIPSIRSMRSGRVLPA